MKIRVAVQSGGGGGGVVTRVKDGCHTEPGLKVGQLSEGQPGDKGLRYQKASESAV